MRRARSLCWFLHRLKAMDEMTEAEEIAEGLRALSEDEEKERQKNVGRLREFADHLASFDHRPHGRKLPRIDLVAMYVKRRPIPGRVLVDSDATSERRARLRSVCMLRRARLMRGYAKGRIFIGKGVGSCPSATGRYKG